MDEPIEKLYRCIETAFDHLGVRGYVVYCCTNYIDVRLAKLLGHIMEHKETAVTSIPSELYKNIADATDEFLDYLAKNDNRYFLPSSGWYTLTSSEENIKKISDIFRQLGEIGVN